MPCFHQIQGHFLRPPQRSRERVDHPPLDDLGDEQARLSIPVLALAPHLGELVGPLEGPPAELCREVAGACAVHQRGGREPRPRDRLGHVEHFDPGLQHGGPVRGRTRGRGHLDDAVGGDLRLAPPDPRQPLLGSQRRPPQPVPRNSVPVFKYQR